MGPLTYYTLPGKLTGPQGSLYYQTLPVVKSQVSNLASPFFKYLFICLRCFLSL